MIHLALNTITSELNDYLRRSSSASEEKAILSNLVDQEGAIAFPGEHKVVGMLTSIEQEHTSFHPATSHTTRQNPPLQLKLNVLFAAYFPGNYLEALQSISQAIIFFQGKQVFTPQNTPGLPAGVEKVTVEFNNLDQQAQHQLWQAIGAKMMPSFSIQVRMAALSGDQIMSEMPEITGLDITASPNS